MSFLNVVFNMFSPLPPLEAFANSSWSTECTPDDIIVASLLESVVKETGLWGNWKAGDYFDRTASKTVLSDKTRKWINAKDGPTVPIYLQRYGNEPLELIIRRGGWGKTSKDRDGQGPWFYRPSPTSGCVIEFNGVTLNSQASDRFLTTFKKIKADAAKAKEIADRCFAAMEENEKKWNVAETMLGMKRNEFGALVPVDKE